jgi:hypothetical protein
MKKARALVGYFSCSSQATETLKDYQIREPSQLCLIQDVCTRWWSTWNMIQRLVTLRKFITRMADDGLIDCNLIPDEWGLLEEIGDVLEPFMVVQRVLEGQKYPTLSFVPFLISRCRKGLMSVVQNSNSHVVRELADRLLNHPTKNLIPTGVLELMVLSLPRMPPLGIANVKKGCLSLPY